MKCWRALPTRMRAEKVTRALNRETTKDRCRANLSEWANDGLWGYHGGCSASEDLILYKHPFIISGLRRVPSFRCRLRHFYHHYHHHHHHHQPSLFLPFTCLCLLFLASCLVRLWVPALPYVYRRKFCLRMYVCVCVCARTLPVLLRLLAR